MDSGGRLVGGILRFASGTVATLLLHGVPTVAAGTPPEKIPLSVSDVRVHDMGRRAKVTFTLHNNSPDRLVAWSLEFEFLYPDGYRASNGFATHCHLTAMEQGAQECEVGPGEYREGRPVYLSLRNGRLPALRAARFDAAVLETPGSPGEKWLGNRERIEDLLRTHARRQSAWGELLRVLEDATNTHALTRTAVRVAYEQLADEAAKDSMRGVVRAELMYLLQDPSRGEASEAEAIDRLLRRARLESAPLLWLEAHHRR